MGKWIQTTLRKGTKTPSICRDMFITDSRGRFIFVQVKNGRIARKEVITAERAQQMIEDNKLVKSDCMFTNCFTYRDYESARLVDRLRVNV